MVMGPGWTRGPFLECVVFAHSCSPPYTKPSSLFIDLCCGLTAQVQASHDAPMTPQDVKMHRLGIPGLHHYLLYGTYLGKNT